MIGLPAFSIMILMLQSGTPPAAAGRIGTITASVTDLSGNPIEGATVWMRISDGRPQAGAIPSCLTNAFGLCSRSELAPGKYVVTAMKESDGYPNMALEVFNHGKALETARISAEDPSANVAIGLGPRAATVAFNVLDSSTGAPIPNPTVTLRLADDPEVFLSTGLHGDHKVLIPPDEDILVEISAKGYQPWHMETQSGAAHADAIRLHSQDESQFTVNLRPQ